MLAMRVPRTSPIYHRARCRVRALRRATFRAAAGRSNWLASYSSVGIHLPYLAAGAGLRPVEPVTEHHDEDHRNRPRHEQLGGIGPGRRTARSSSPVGGGDHRRRREGVPVVRGLHQGRPADRRGAGAPAGRSPTPKGTVTAFKRKMGTDFKYQASTARSTPPSSSRAFLLQKIKRDAEAFLGREGREGRHHRPGVLQRQPAPGDQGRRARSRASRSCASSTSRRPPPSPTASTRRGKDQKILVFDLGGGTLDVTIMEFGEGVFEVLSTSGDTQLGGTDMDNVAHRVRRRRVPEGDRHRHPQGQDGDAARPRRGREGEDRALQHPRDPDQPPVPDGDRTRARSTSR